VDAVRLLPEKEEMRMRRVAGVQRLIFVVFVLGAIATAAGLGRTDLVMGVGLGVAILLVGWAISASIHIANQWEKAVVLRLGKFRQLAGPGTFFLLPIVDTVADWIDLRVRSTTFTAEQTLTKDTVPVNIDAVLFWVVVDAEKAALQVADYEYSLSWAAQTALRDLIGRMMLEDMLSSREAMDAELKRLLDERTGPWGISIQSVQIRDIKIPGNLQDAMSRAAQAERERNARVILGQAEVQVAESFLEAARLYHSDPVALQLRAMNILYEGLKEKASMIVVPSALSDAMNLGTWLGVANAERMEDMRRGGDRG